MIVGKRTITKEDVGDRARLSALNMYSTPPMEQISLTEFEDFALDRLRCAPKCPALAQPQFAFTPRLNMGWLHACANDGRGVCCSVLSTIDMARAKGMKGEQYAETIRKAVKQHMPLSQPGLRKDYFSHFILRLAYCRT